jgi:hypothetical protein
VNVFMEITCKIAGFSTFVFGNIWWLLKDLVPELLSWGACDNLCEFF